MNRFDGTLDRDAHGRLVYLTADGVRHAGIVPVRAFPIAAPLEGISLVSADGHEVAWIERLDELRHAVRDCLEEELAAREFAPEIRRIVEVSTYSTPSTWRVVTERGAAEFVLKGEEDIRRLANRALLVTSAHGIGFVIRDVATLDAVSRRMLERFL